MKKIAYWMFLMMIGIEECCSANIAQVKTTLNSAFGRAGGNDIFIITFTRTPINDGNPTALISHDEFKQILKLLYGLCTNRNAPVYAPMTQLSNDPNCEAIRFSRNCISNVITLSDQLKAFFNHNDMQQACKIIVFNEMFFSQERPLTGDQKNFVVDKIMALSRRATNSIFYANFLYTEDRDITGISAHNDYRHMRNLKRRNRIVIDESEFDSLRDHIKNIPNNANNIRHSYLINETYAINNGNILTRYKKSSYFHESDEEIGRGSLYDAGNGRDEGMLNTPLTARLLNSISTEICFDLACGVRQRNQWNNFNLGGQQSILHLIQSNWINPFENSVPNDNINRLPQNICIIHSDSYINDLHRKLFYINGGHVGHILSDNILYSIEIGDSIYTVGICRI